MFTFPLTRNLTISKNILSFLKIKNIRHTFLLCMFHEINFKYIHRNIFYTFHLKSYRRYMADILPIRRKTVYNQSKILSHNGDLTVSDTCILLTSMEKLLRSTNYVELKVIQNITAI